MSDLVAHLRMSGQWEAADEIERLRKLLNDYGRHTSSCRQSDVNATHPWPIPCTCGWQNARWALTP